MEAIYDQFTSKAAEGRGMDAERIKSLAGGRIWTGRQAEQNGLVDQLGTLADAIRLTRGLAEVPADDETQLLILPKSKSFFEQLFEGPDAELRMPLGSPFSGLMRQAPKDAWTAYQLLQEPFLCWLPYHIAIQ